MKLVDDDVAVPSTPVDEAEQLCFESVPEALVHQIGRVHGRCARQWRHQPAKLISKVFAYYRAKMLTTALDPSNIKLLVLHVALRI